MSAESPELIERLRAAAIDYVSHGWAVLPGPAFDGLGYTRGHVPEPVDGLHPVLRSARSLRSVREVWAWWSLAPYAILTRAGDDFDVLSAPTWLAVAGTQRSEFSRHPCPVLISPEGVRLLVAPGVGLLPELAGVRGVELITPGSVVPLPPTRMRGSVTWWITPDQVDWQLGDPGVVQDALRQALPHDVTDVELPGPPTHGAPHGNEDRS